jgi:hypothetical protein
MSFCPSLYALKPSRRPGTQAASQTPSKVSDPFGARGSARGYAPLLHRFVFSVTVVLGVTGCASAVESSKVEDRARRTVRTSG